MQNTEGREIGNLATSCAVKVTIVTKMLQTDAVKFKMGWTWTIYFPKTEPHVRQYFSFRRKINIHILRHDKVGKDNRQISQTQTERTKESTRPEVLLPMFQDCKFIKCCPRYSAIGPGNVCQSKCPSGSPRRVRGETLTGTWNSQRPHPEAMSLCPFLYRFNGRS